MRTAPLDARPDSNVLLRDRGAVDLHGTVRCVADGLGCGRFCGRCSEGGHHEGECHHRCHDHSDQWFEEFPHGRLLWPSRGRIVVVSLELLKAACGPTTRETTTSRAGVPASLIF